MLAVAAEMAGAAAAILVVGGVGQHRFHPSLVEKLGAAAAVLLVGAVAVLAFAVA